MTITQSVTDHGQRNPSLTITVSKVQTGPPWHCFECGAPATRLACYDEFLPPNAIPKPVDRWGAHIWYLYLPAACRQAGHVARVARLGDAITPLMLYDPSAPRATGKIEMIEREEQAIARIREALARIAAAHGPNPQADPTAAIVWKLIAGAITPEAAIAEIREMTQSAVLAALDVQPQPNFIFSEVA